MKYVIYQIPPKMTREYGFMGLKEFKRRVKKIDLTKHDKVYEGEIRSTDNIHKDLENLFLIFNTQHPSDYTSRSMSVGDIVNIDTKFFYCDSFGFQEIFMEE